MIRKKELPLAQAYGLLEPGPVVLVTTARAGRANITPMSWHTMMEFEPPLVGCVVSNRNYMFETLRKRGECGINIPTALPRVVAAATPPSEPYLLLVFADDMGYADAGRYLGKEIPTPHLDQLAASSVRFTSSYATAPLCAASRATLMTGRYQTRFGFEFNPIGDRNVEAGADFSYGAPLPEIAMLGVIALKLLGTKLEWDAKKMQFTNSTEANHYVNPPYREG